MSLKGVIKHDERNSGATQGPKDRDSYNSMGIPVTSWHLLFESLDVSLLMSCASFYNLSVLNVK